MEELQGEVGNWVDKKRFFGREHELASLIELIKEGANISIIAQRRIGKTSLMHETANRLPPSYLSLHIDLQDAKCSADFVVKLGVATRPHASIWRKTKDVFANSFTTITDSIDSISLSELGIHFRAGLAGSSWQGKGETLLGHLAAQDKPVVLFVDELPILVNRMLKSAQAETGAAGAGEADILLSWLRKCNLAHQGQVRMVLAGSIGLEPILRRAGLSATLNHLTPFILEPWDEQIALRCVNALAKYRKLRCPPAVAQRMLDLLGCGIPYHVQLFFSYLRAYCLKNGKTECSLDDVENVYRHQMLGTKGHAELAHMEERLRQVLEPDENALASEILTQASVKGVVTPLQAKGLCARMGIPTAAQAALLRNLFDLLEHDGYLLPTAEGYRFISKLLGDWWKARFGQFFEPL